MRNIPPAQLCPTVEEIHECLLAQTRAGIASTYPPKDPTFMPPRLRAECEAGADIGDCSEFARPAPPTPQAAVEANDEAPSLSNRNGATATPPSSSRTSANAPPARAESDNVTELRNLARDVGLKGYAELSQEEASARAGRVTPARAESDSATELLNLARRARLKGFGD